MERALKTVLHVNTSDSVGGAARAARRLHEGLGRLEWDSWIVAGRARSREASVTTLVDEAATVLPRRLATMERTFLKGSSLLGERWMPFPSSRAFASTSVFDRASVVNLHNLHGNYFDYKVLSRWAERKPIVWTFHDMWPVTGHCAYSHGCDRWILGCHHCPLFAEEKKPLDDIPQPRRDNSAPEWRRKHGAYATARLTIVSPSAWLLDIAASSMLAERGGAVFHHIPYGLDTEIYRPLDRTQARAMLGIPSDDAVILLGAASPTQERKGWTLLREALPRLEQAIGDFSLIVLGPAEDSRLPSRRVYMLGECSDQRLQTIAYSAADVAVVPSRADNQPLVMLEAMACAVPVVAFEVGGIPEVVRHMETGYCATPFSPEDLALGLERLLVDQELRRKLGDASRKAIVSSHSLESQAARYVDVYEEQIEAYRAPGATSSPNGATRPL